MMKRWLYATDLLTFLYAGGLSWLIWAFHWQIPNWPVYLASAAAVPAAVLILMIATKMSRAPWVHALRSFDLVVTVPVLFLVTIGVVHHINPIVYDATLARMDRWIGVLLKVGTISESRPSICLMRPLSRRFSPS